MERKKTLRSFKIKDGRSKKKNNRMASFGKNKKENRRCKSKKDMEKFVSFKNIKVCFIKNRKK